mmetsp:Transcript_9819/g.20918  ORF Transcript_9819/g.20918 Transcript_9819/m.20918 type:complete len:109 (+) Transcript_9819:2715-3041(+)
MPASINLPTASSSPRQGSASTKHASTLAHRCRSHSILIQNRDGQVNIAVNCDTTINHTNEYNRTYAGSADDAAGLSKAVRSSEVDAGLRQATHDLNGVVGSLTGIGLR